VVTYLDAILVWHRERVSRDDRPIEALLEQARKMPPARPFESALRAASDTGPGLAVIAEIKRRSPSKGPLAPDLSAASLARAYERGGASCLSVLTDTRHFGGSPADLQEARAATALPALRKDFTIDVADVADARCMGADAVLLIVAALVQPLLVDLVAAARELGVDPLVECHDEDEVERALSAGEPPKWLVSVRTLRQAAPPRSPPTWWLRRWRPAGPTRRDGPEASSEPARAEPRSGGRPG